MKTKDSFLYLTLTKSKLIFQDPKDKNVRLYRLTKFAEEAQARAEKAFHGESEEEQKDTLYWSSSDINLDDETTVEYKPDEDTLDITVQSELGYFNFSVPLDLDIKIGIVEAVTKQFNKVKSMLESAK